MKLIDSHCHLEKAAKAGELAGVLERAAAADVESCITVGTGLKDWELYRSIAEKHPRRVHWTVGIHPGCVEETWADEIKAIPSYFATDPLPVALGEIGLDYFHLPKFPDEAAEVRSRQMAAFRAQLELAYQLDCPVIVHSRNAFADCVRMVDESGVDWRKVVFHCFVEGPESLAILRERGGWASFTGIVSYKAKNADAVRASARTQDPARLMVETDAPYLTPEPHRGRPNEPAYVRHVAEALARELDMPLEALAELTTANTQRFFRLP